MPSEARILADSITPSGHRLTTFLSKFPRIILAEVNTHKMISKSSASSRAIPVPKKIASVKSDPFLPAVFGRNQKGMQPGVEIQNTDAARAAWRLAREDAITGATKLAALDVHKQYANRLLEPFSWHTAVLSGTDWSNVWNLRVSPEAQGEFQDIAGAMKELYETKEHLRVLSDGEWHLPFVDPGESFDLEVGHMPGVEIAKISAARCARVSYNTQDGRRDPDEDRALYGRLVEPGHMAPLEHPARPMTTWERNAFRQYEAGFETPEGLRTMRVSGDFLEAVTAEEYKDLRIAGDYREVFYCGNYNGWVQLRKLVAGEADIKGYRRGASR